MNKKSKIKIISGILFIISISASLFFHFNILVNKSIQNHYFPQNHYEPNYLPANFVLILSIYFLIAFFVGRFNFWQKPIKALQ
jgi:hypothetical protein